MTTKWVWAVALVAAGAVTPASWAQNPAPRAHTATILMTGGTYLGVGVVDVDSERAKTLKLKEDRGVGAESGASGAHSHDFNDGRHLSRGGRRGCGFRARQDAEAQGRPRRGRRIRRLGRTQPRF